MTLIFLIMIDAMQSLTYVESLVVCVLVCKTQLNRHYAAGMLTLMMPSLYIFIFFKTAWTMGSRESKLDVVFK